MKSDEAKRLLEVFRPGGADMGDPRFVEALVQTERDPQLGRWFDEQRRFDNQFLEGLKTVSVPADLQGAILAGRKVVHPGHWHDWRVRVAVAASVAILAIAGGVLATSKPNQFADFRAELIEQAWDGNTHLDLESSDVRQIQTWLASKHVPAEFALPDGLRDTRLLGCRIVEANGLRVPMLCLADGPKHMHLFVLEGSQLEKLPFDDKPDFEKCGMWKTASWQQGDMTYVLTGMKYQTFVNKFRKGGRWTMSG
jgi:hypothetical protein